LFGHSCITNRLFYLLDAGDGGRFRQPEIFPLVKNAVFVADQNRFDRVVDAVAFVQVERRICSVGGQVEDDLFFYAFGRRDIFLE
jgi:hypothetical protein